MRISTNPNRPVASSRTVTTGGLWWPARRPRGGPRWRQQRHYHPRLPWRQETAGARRVAACATGGWGAESSVSRKTARSSRMGLTLTTMMRPVSGSAAHLTLTFRAGTSRREARVHRKKEGEGAVGGEGSALRKSGAAPGSGRFPRESGTRWMREALNRFAQQLLRHGADGQVAHVDLPLLLVVVQAPGHGHRLRRPPCLAPSGVHFLGGWRDRVRYEISE